MGIADVIERLLGLHPRDGRNLDGDPRPRFKAVMRSSLKSPDEMRALQIALLRLIAQHGNDPAAKPFMTRLVSVDTLPWTAAHGRMLMRTLVDEYAISRLHIPMDKVTLNRALRRANVADDDIVFHAVRRLKTPTCEQVQMFREDLRFTVPVSRWHPELLDREETNELLIHVAGKISAGQVLKVLSELPDDFLTNETCLKILDAFSEDHDVKRAISRKMPLYACKALWDAMMVDKDMKDIEKVLMCRTARRIDPGAVQTMAETGHMPLIRAILDNPHIPWTDSSAQDFLSHIPEGDAKLKKLVADELARKVAAPGGMEDDCPDLSALFGDNNEPDEDVTPPDSVIAALEAMDALAGLGDEDTQPQDAAMSAQDSSVNRLKAEEARTIRYKVVSGALVSGTTRETRWPKLVGKAVDSLLLFGGSLPEGDAAHGNAAHGNAAHGNASAIERVRRLQDELEWDYPNFQEVTRLLMGQLFACVTTSRPIRFHPMLLLGDPGVGKTSYLQDVCERLSLTFRRVDMGITTASFALTGSHESWSAGQPGVIAKTFLLEKDKAVANPVFILDEIDKSDGDRRYPVVPALLPLLERKTAQTFQDEFLEGVTFDLTHVSFFMTANRIDHLPDSFLSRVLVVEVPAPTLADKRSIAQRMYQKKLREMGIDGRYAGSLHQEITGLVCENSLREIDRDLSLAITNAMLRMGDGGEVTLMREDFRGTAKRPGMGFGG
jgi:ATP-dependent Lon protease